MSNFPLAPISFLADKVSEQERQYFTNHSGLVMETDKLYARDADIQLLDEALKTIRKKSAFVQIVTEYPALNEASLRMAGYFTHLVPADGGMSLLCKALFNAINNFNQAHKKYYMHNDPSIKMSSFIYGVSACLHEILLNQIYGRYEDSWVQWKPLTEPVLNWISRYQFTHVLVVPTSENVSEISFNIAANKLLFAIFNFSDLSLCEISSVQNATSIQKDSFPTINT